MRKGYVKGANLRHIYKPLTDHNYGGLGVWGLGGFNDLHLPLLKDYKT